MKLKPSVISTIVLWICMIISLSVFALLYTAGVTDPLLYYLYGILFLTAVVAILFSILKFLKKLKDNPASAIRSLLFLVLIVALLLFTYLSGNRTPLPISGYEGSENTPFYLQLTDMWLYSIYVLLGLAFFAVFGGIIRSYIKKWK